MPPKAQLQPQPPSSLEAKLEAALAKLDTLDEIKAAQEATNALLQEHITRVARLEVDVANIMENNTATSNNLAVHDREISALKVTSNNNSQLLKATTARILGYPVTSDETDSPSNYLRDVIYNRLLLPVLTAAAAANFLSDIPSPSASLSRVFRAGRPSSGSTSPPPPIIVVFSSLTVKQAIFYFKGKAMPNPNPSERSLGAKKFIVIEDLTKDNHRALKALQADDRVAKVWTVDGQIRFIRVNEERVVRVTNVYQPVNTIIEGY